MKVYRGYVSKIPHANLVDTHVARKSGPQVDVQVKSDNKSNKTKVSAEVPVNDNSVHIAVQTISGWVVKPPNSLDL